MVRMGWGADGVEGCTVELLWCDRLVRCGRRDDFQWQQRSGKVSWAFGLDREDRRRRKGAEVFAAKRMISVVAGHGHDEEEREAGCADE
ncbi:hypothetical protein M0R45_019559 [Rubus argutus]|uniref:MHC class I antigen n=1 Tax=Rubus argutus TaxID=59490 RepID=A0AAW1VPV5_RUBAR